MIKSLTMQSLESFYRLHSDRFLDAELSIGQEFDQLAPNLCFIKTFNDEANTGQSIFDFERPILTSSIAL